MAFPRLSLSRATTDLTVTRNDPALPLLLELGSPSASVIAEPVPRVARRTIAIVTSLFFAIVLAASTIRIDQVVAAQGETISKLPTLVVQPLDTSIVRSIDVRVGQTVQAGQVLARLDPTFAAADLGALTSEVASLQALVMRLRAEARGTSFAYSGTSPDLALQAAIYTERQAEYHYRLQSYRESIDGLRAEILRAESDARAYRERLAVAVDVENMRKELQALQAGSKLGTLAAIDNRTEIGRDYLDAVQNAQAAKRRLAAQVAQRGGFVQAWHADVSQKLVDALSKLSDARQQLRKAELRRHLVVLRADRDATVLTVAKISVGSVVQSGQQLFTLMPAGAPLEVEANIRGSEAGYVHVGDPVAIKFATFPFTRYGLAYGTLSVISPDSVTGLDAQGNQAGAMPLPPGETAPYYRARITLDRVALHGTPAGLHLAPGMPIEADVKVGRHTVLQYLLQRILPLASDAMREPG